MRQAKIDRQTMLGLFEANQDMFIVNGPSFSRRHGAGLFIGFQDDMHNLETSNVILFDSIKATISGISQLFYTSFMRLFAAEKPASMTEDDFVWVQQQSKRLLVPYQVMVLCECRPNHWAMIKVDTF